MNLIIKDSITLTFNVTQCAIAKYDGEHTITMDLSKLTNDDVEQYLAQTLIIKMQSKLRSKNATDDLVKQTWVVPAPGKRVSTDPIKTFNKAKSLLDKFTPEQLAELMKMYGGMSHAAIAEDLDDGEPTPVVEKEGEEV